MKTYIKCGYIHKLQTRNPRSSPRFSDSVNSKSTYWQVIHPLPVKYCSPGVSLESTWCGWQHTGNRAGHALSSPKLQIIYCIWNEAWITALICFVLFLIHTAAFPLIRQQKNSLYPDSSRKGLWQHGLFQMGTLGIRKRALSLENPNTVISRRHSLSLKPLSASFWCGGTSGKVLQPFYEDTCNLRDFQKMKGARRF